ncbi:site-2 protease family protein [Thermus sediminis]|uniref:site-2 protease family protein n=1 Tax=Thermus sediminis TaxID=1761908 RepID=UPI000E3D5DA4|nr:site-2 protease family protein [Thermus sediminis]
MLQRGFPLLRILGIPVHLDFTFLLILPLLAFLIGRNLPLYLGLFGLPRDPSLLEGQTPYLLGLAAALGLFLSVLLHELGHALTARHFGIKTQRITLWLLGGVAQMERIPKEPKKEFLIAIAGPLVSFALAILFWLLRQEAGALGFLTHYLALVNFILGVFNLLPALPLDGGRVYRALLATRQPYVKATQKALTLSQVVAFVLGLFGLLVLNPFLILIAFFVYMASRADAEATFLAQALEGLKVKDLMTQDPIVVPKDLPVAELLQLSLAHRVSGFPVVEAGRVLGVVGLEGLEGADPMAPVDRYLQEPLLLSPEDSALSALQRMGERNYPRALVMEGEALLGILSKTDLLRAFQVRLLGLSSLDKPKGMG